VPASSVSGLTSSPRLPSSDLFARSIYGLSAPLNDRAVRSSDFRFCHAPKSREEELRAEAVEQLHEHFERIRTAHHFVYHVTIYGGKTISAARASMARFRLWFSRCRSEERSYIAMRSRSPKGHWHYHVLLGVNKPFEIEEWKRVPKIQLSSDANISFVLTRPTEVMYSSLRRDCYEQAEWDVYKKVCEDPDWIHDEENLAYHARDRFAELWTKVIHEKTLLPYSSERLSVFDYHMVPAKSSISGMVVPGALRWKVSRIGHYFDRRRIRFNFHNDLRQLAEYWISEENFNPEASKLTSSRSIQVEKHLRSALLALAANLATRFYVQKKVYSAQFVSQVFPHLGYRASNASNDFRGVDTRARAVAAGPSRSIEDLSLDRFALFRSAIALSLGREQLPSLLSEDLSMHLGNHGQWLSEWRRESGREIIENTLCKSKTCRVRTAQRDSPGKSCHFSGYI